MLPAGFRRTAQAGLRSQLRDVITGLGRRRGVQPWQRCLPLSTACTLHEEATVHAGRRHLQTREDRDYVYRHIHPHGRIVGKPGRRQRQSSEQLATASLGKPSEVIVFRDVEGERVEHRQAPVSRGQVVEGDTRDEDQEEVALSAGEIQGLVSGEQHPPEQEEINASIESLRPHGAVLERQEYDTVKKQLLSSYNVEQLARYLVQAATHADVSLDASREDEHDARKIRRTAWRPGQSPLEQRLGRVSFNKGQLSNSKVGLADQVLRVAWNAIVRSDEQRLGELELYVRRWQITLLFDVLHEGKRNIESFINSPLLTRASDIRPYRRDNVIRITARQRDAKEIVRLLERRFRFACREELDLTVFKPLLGRRGWPETFEELFRDDDLKYVSERTNTVIEVEPKGMVVINSIYESGKLSHARRLLLSLLELPSSRDRHAVMHAEASTHRRRGKPFKEYSRASGELKLAPYPLMDVHRRYQDRDLRRLVAPSDSPAITSKSVTVTTGDPSTSGLSEVPGGAHERYLTSILVGKLDSLALKHARSDYANEEHSPWSAEQHPTWWSAKMGVLLQPPPTMNGKESSRQKGVFFDQVAGLPSLLSLFEPAETDDERSLKVATKLITHLRPSPFSLPSITALEYLPRIQMCFDHTFIPGHAAVQNLKLESVSAATKEQELNIALPYSAVDLSFLLPKTMSLDTDAWNDPELRDFVHRLQHSLQSGTSALDGKPGIKLKLPRSIASLVSPKEQKPEKQEANAAVNYLLDYFEQVQVRDYVPLRDAKRVARMTPEARAVADEWPESIILRCREIDAGAFGGRRTEVSLVHAPNGPDEKTPGEPSARGQDSSVNLPKLPNEAGGKNPQVAPLSKQTKKADTLAQQLVRTALAVARLVTRANAGKLDSPYADTLPRFREQRISKEQYIAALRQ